MLRPLPTRYSIDMFLLEFRAGAVMNNQFGPALSGKVRFLQRLAKDIQRKRQCRKFDMYRNKKSDICVGKGFALVKSDINPSNGLKKRHERHDSDMTIQSFPHRFGPSRWVKMRFFLFDFHVYTDKLLQVSRISKTEIILHGGSENESKRQTTQYR